MRFRGQRMGLKSGLALAGAIALAMPAKSKAQIAQYNFANGDATGVTLATMETATSIATNSSVGSLLLGSKTDTALDEDGAASAFWASPVPDYVSISRDATAAATDDTNFYVDFTVTAGNGFVLDPTSLTLVGGQGGGTASTRTYYVFDSNDGLPTGTNTLTGPGTGTPPPPFDTVNSGTLVGQGAFDVVRGAGATMDSPTITFPSSDQNLFSFEVRVYFDTPTDSQNIDLASITLNGSVVTAPPVLLSTWTSSSSGDYNARANWSSGSPNFIGAEADFLGAITSNQVVFTTTPITLGKIVFNNSAASYALTGAVGANLTLQASSGSAVVDVQAGTHEINLPLTLASNTTFQTDVSSANLIIANPMTINSGISLTTTGSGTVTYDSTITLLSGATMSIASSTYAHGLTINANAAVSLAPTTSSKTLLQVDSLSLAGSSAAWTGKLDLANNDLIIHSGSSGESVYGTTLSQVASGRGANGAWTGTGITSSAAALTKNTALAVVVNDTHQTPSGSLSGTPLFSTFDNKAVSDGDVLEKYTYYGDATLSGSVTSADYLQIDNAYNNNQAHPSTPLIGWYNGDFNYDGVVNGDDYTLIDNAYNTQGSVSFAGVSAGPAEMIAGASSSAVPEPATLSMISIGAAGLVMRRRRRCW